LLSAYEKTLHGKEALGSSREKRFFKYGVFSDMPSMLNVLLIRTSCVNNPGLLIKGIAGVHAVDGAELADPS